MNLAGQADSMAGLVSRQFSKNLVRNVIFGRNSRHFNLEGVRDQDSEGVRIHLLASILANILRLSWTGPLTFLFLDVLIHHEIENETTDETSYNRAYGNLRADRSFVGYRPLRDDWSIVGFDAKIEFVEHCAWAAGNE